MENQFKMNVMGREENVAEFMTKLQAVGVTTVTNREIISGALENGQPYIKVLSAGTQNDLTVEQLRDLSKETGILAELYTWDEDKKVQEHIIVDRGSVYQNAKRELEPHNIREMTEGELNEFLDWEGLTKEEVLEAAEDGVYYTGGFENFMQMSPHLSFYLAQEPREFYEYDSSYGGNLYVTTAMDIYEYGDNLYLSMGAYDEELGALDHYGDITVNVAPLPYLEAAIDTNNNGGNILPLLVNNGLAQPAGRVLQSGFCEYPVVRFNEDKLRQLFPEKMAEYAQLRGIDLASRKPSLDKQISEAEKRTAQQTAEGKEKRFEK